jgi:hypothetical protein
MLGGNDAAIVCIGNNNPKPAKGGHLSLIGINMHRRIVFVFELSIFGGSTDLRLCRRRSYIVYICHISHDSQKEIVAQEASTKKIHLCVTGLSWRICSCGIRSIEAQSVLVCAIYSEFFACQYG